MTSQHRKWKEPLCEELGRLRASGPAGFGAQQTNDGGGGAGGMTATHGFLCGSQLREGDKGLYWNTDILMP